MPNWFINAENIYTTRGWARNILTKLDHRRDKIKKFDCLLGKQKPERDFIATQYASSPVKDQIIFSYFKNNITEGIWEIGLADKSKTGDTIILDDEEARISCILPISIYNQSYYSIVAETTCTNLYSHYTEKTAKPIIARRPFIVFAGQYFLKNLKSLGFKTFSDVIDESYDNIEDRNVRFQMAWAQVESLCLKDPNEVLDRLSPNLEHNYRLFFDTDWHASVKTYLDN